MLVVDDFFVEYVGKQHAEHLAKVLKKYHTISEDWKAKKFVGIDLEWNYAKTFSDRSCRLSMNNYIADLLFKLKHPNPRKPQKNNKMHKISETNIRKTRTSRKAKNIYYWV